MERCVFDVPIILTGIPQPGYEFTGWQVALKNEKFKTEIKQNKYICYTRSKS